MKKFPGIVLFGILFVLLAFMIGWFGVGAFYITSLGYFALIALILSVWVIVYFVEKKGPKGFLVGLIIVLILIPFLLLGSALSNQRHYYHKRQQSYGAGS